MKSGMAPELGHGRWRTTEKRALCEDRPALSFCRAAESTNCRDFTWRGIVPQRSKIPVVPTIPASFGSLFVSVSGMSPRHGLAAPYGRRYFRRWRIRKSCVRMRSRRFYCRRFLGDIPDTDTNSEPNDAGIVGTTGIFERCGTIPRHVKSRQLVDSTALQKLSAGRPSQSARFSVVLHLPCPTSGAIPDFIYFSGTRTACWA